MSYEYNDFSDEMREYLNKAMDIYNTVRDGKIVRRFDILNLERGFSIKKEYELSKLDKRMLSLFMASYLVEGSISDFVNNYDDIKIEHLLDFVGISDIKDISCVDGDYGEFYDKNFKIDIISFIERLEECCRKVNEITPYVILSSIEAVYSGEEVNIFNYLLCKYNIDAYDFSDLSIFKALDSYLVSSNSVVDYNIDNYFDKEEGNGSVPVVRTSLEKEVVVDDIVWDLLDEVLGKFVGQEEYVKDLFYNILNNHVLTSVIGSSGVVDGERSIIFVDGPSGTGKTAVAKDIAMKFGLPLVITSMTDYSASGYVGGDIEDILVRLFENAKRDLEMAESGIIILDEFDKLSYSDSDGLEMKKAVQQQLLNFLGGGKYLVNIGSKIVKDEIEFDTSRLTFIALGALTDLRNKKTNNKVIGFGNNVSNGVKTYDITPQDLIKLGFEKELIGRFNTYLHTVDYSKDDLMRILRESMISPLVGFNNWVMSFGKRVDISDDVYNVIVDKAYELDTGARSLQTIMNNIRTKYIKEVLRGKDKIVSLGVDDVINVSNKMVKRKVRG